jgi:hypothetical protein
VCPYCTRAHSNWSGFDQDVDDVVPLANKPWGQPVSEGQDQDEEEMGPRVAEIWVYTGEAGNRLRWESIKGVQIDREAEGISFQGPGEDEIKEQQRVDPELAWVIRWRETGEEPTEGELFIGDSRSKYYWINREVFVLEKGVLWREGDEGKSARRVVPKMYREQIVKLYHDPPLAGYQGIERTIEKVKSRYYWRGISKDVSAYVKGCMKCNQNKKATVSARHPMLSYHSGSPMELVHLDFIGPPIATYIYYLIILGGRIIWIMTIRFFLRDIRIDSWCIVGVGDATESGDSSKRCPMDIGSLGLVEAFSASCEP